MQATFLDGCAVLWVVPWPTSGNVHDYLVRFRSYLHGHLAKSDVYLVFDRYIEGSTKEATRCGRDKGASRVYTLRCKARLPPQKVVLTVTTNKAQLIALVIEDLVSHKADFQKHKLVVTGRDPVPVEIANGCVNKRQDMSTTKEEGDTLIVADNTDIFVLLFYFCHQGSIYCKVLMVLPIQGQSVLDINAAAEEHSSIVPDLLPAHGLTGCDTVASYFSIGKVAALKVLRHGQRSLNLLGNTDGPPFLEVVDQATHFMLACYGQQRCHSMMEARQQMWFSKVSRSKASTPKLCSLPPTSEVFEQNVARTHLQVAIWLHAFDPNRPVLDPTSYGWSQEGSTALSPTTVPPDTSLAPTGLLKLIKCSCRSEMPCSTNKCSCNSSDKYVLHDEDEED